ncbi:hypothetical protein CHS0354_004155 [Potamilus streckersoni]|uniref:FIT family protein n=1 Tax=Potamilus streckersoni TaxID=2493646 RepID=A0AAE0W4N3_9BIVA|nr:hypothetical protein CHS0354_004155 [Potamilus streckersoni]
MATAKEERRPRGRQTQKGTGKKSLPPPTNVGHFIIILSMKICKTILMIDTAVKVGIYLVGVMIASILSDLFAFPKSYFSDSKNILNRIFVSFGFGWTFIALAFFIFFTSFIYTCGDWKRVLRNHFTRLVIATVWWYVCTKSFVLIDSVVGVCSKKEFTNKIACVKEGKAWLGFDISGHIFLLVHNLLIISEEVKCFDSWTNLEKMLDEEDITIKKNLTEQQVSQAKVSYRSLTPFIKINIVFITLLSVLWEFLLVISTIYRFHTLTQKIAAAFLAVGCWFVSYRMLFISGWSWFPDPPGCSPFQFIKNNKSRCR